MGEPASDPTAWAKWTKPIGEGSFPGMQRRQLGRLSLRLDAAYCGLAALLLLVFAGPAATRLGVPAWVILVAAVGTAGWAVVLRHLADRTRLRPWLIVVLTANVVAAGLIAILAATRPYDVFTVLLAAVAVEVAAFAASQAAALRQPI